MADTMPIYEGTAITSDYGNPKKPKKINQIAHPDYLALSSNWLKWRLTYIGGDDFKDTYLFKFSHREEHDSFCDRKLMTYVPAFAKTGINEIRNAIFQRLTDIVRITTSPSYNESVLGKNGGVDRKGSTMEYFLGSDVLTELLVMGRVGIYVDNANVTPTNFAQSYKIKPYMYLYKAEQIRSWTRNENGELLTVLLEDIDYDFDLTYGLPMDVVKRYRYYWYGDDGYVRCQIYNENGDPYQDEMRLGIRVIPFHILELSSSLMTEVCDYQIALMNMASSDIQFARLANLPVWAEKYEPMADIAAQYMAGLDASTSEDTDGAAAKANEAKTQEKRIGTLTGRRYPTSVEYPKWISPDTKALESSMAKQEQMKTEIRTLLFLALGNLQPNKQSADSKQQDVSQEENGLSYIGFELSKAEHKICEFWLAYENNNDEFLIKYPKTFCVKTVEERLTEATTLGKLVQSVPSLTYKKEVTKMMACSLLSGRVAEDVLDKIHKEVDQVINIVDPQQLIMDVENKLVGLETASEIAGYPEGEVEKAVEDAVEIAGSIMEAQTPDMPQGGAMENPAARGVPELSGDPKGDVQRDRNKNQTYKPRGKGKKPDSTKKSTT